MIWIRSVLLLILALSFGTIPTGTAFAGVDDFTFKSFSADYYLDRDQYNVSTLKTDEKLVAVFPDFDQNHGILRAIPKTYQDHSTEIEILGITNDQGQKWNYTTYEENENLVLKIGDADKFVHGEQVYNISYAQRGVTLNLEHHDEFYWDINGDDWRQPFDKVTARIHIPENIAVNMLAQDRCYTGSRGSTLSACKINSQLDGSDTLVTVTSIKTFTERENMSVALGFKKGTFAEYRPDPADVLRQALMIFFSAAFLPLAVLVYALRSWYQKGRDPKGRGIIVPEYLPPDDLTVLESNALLKEHFEPKAVTAQIIDLAVRRYIKIYEVKKVKKFAPDTTNYELELLKTGEDLTDEEREVLKIVFGASMKAGGRVKLETLKNKLYAQAAKLGKKVNRQLSDNGYFVMPPEKAKRPYMIFGAILFFVSFIFIELSIWVAIGIGLSGAILFFISFAMPARTIKGVHARDYLLGLEDYMKLAEADRIKVLQSPHGSLTEKVDAGDKTQLVKLYERLLPYAMLFGIEKEWAVQFADLYENEPDWYHGTSGFNATYFTSSLGSFAAASNSSFVSPSSSSSGGSGGGGSSGGGGGGGGGGGW